jgi:hypothetical protein
MSVSLTATCTQSIAHMLADALTCPTKPSSDHASRTDVRPQKFHEGSRTSRIFGGRRQYTLDDSAA